VSEQHVPGDLEKRLARVPDLCVEVRSPSTWRYDIGRKKSVYEASGLPELWLVDYDAVLVFRRSQPAEPSFDVALELSREDRLASPQLPGFGLDLAGLFRP
jgi:Uma2 family endonuclease